MTLLQTALDTIEVMNIELEAVMKGAEQRRRPADMAGVLRGCLYDNIFAFLKFKEALLFLVFHHLSAGVGKKKD
jgi:hypothetical protein